MTTRELLFALGLGCLFLGLILAWFREAWGGLLSVLGWGFLAVLARRPAWDLPFSILGAIGLLHLLCWWRLRGPAPPLDAVSSASRAPLKMLAISFWICLAVFILLCANEIFGQPPLMTRCGPPPADLVGTWSAHADEIPVVFTLGQDGSVSGTVGQEQIVTGRFEPSRSWFGRLMHWRTDYWIRGTLSGDRFSAPLIVSGSQMDGSLFLSHPAAPQPLRLHLKKAPAY